MSLMKFNSYFFLYRDIVPNFKITLSPVLREQLNTSTLYSIANDASCSMSLGVSGGDKKNRLSKG